MSTEHQPGRSVTVHDAAELLADVVGEVHQLIPAGTRAQVVEHLVTADTVDVTLPDDTSETGHRFDYVHLSPDQIALMPDSSEPT